MPRGSRIKTQRGQDEPSSEGSTCATPLPRETQEGVTDTVSHHFAGYYQISGTKERKTAVPVQPLSYEKPRAGS